MKFVVQHAYNIQRVYWRTPADTDEGNCQKCLSEKRWRTPMDSPYRASKLLHGRYHAVVGGFDSHTPLPRFHENLLQPSCVVWLAAARVRIQHPYNIQQKNEPGLLQTSANKTGIIRGSIFFAVPCWTWGCCTFEPKKCCTRLREQSCPSYSLRSCRRFCVLVDFPSSGRALQTAVLASCPLPPGAYVAPHGCRYPT